MKINYVLNEIKLMLKTAGIEENENEAVLIVSYVLNIKPGVVATTEEISESNYKKVLKIAKIRCKRIPLQYIIKSAEFINTKLIINKNVLIPRPETELLTDIIIKRINESSGDIKVLDLCCGSGCIGIAIAKNTKAEVHLADVSKKALKVAKKNCKINDVNLKIIHSNLFNKITNKYNIIVSNPPYIKESEIDGLQYEVKKEPLLALSGKEDGLYFYKEIINKARNHLTNSGEIYFEMGSNQGENITKLLEKDFKNIRILKDYYNNERFITAVLKD